MGIATTKTLITVNSNDALKKVESLREAFFELPIGLRRKYLGAAVNRTIEPLLPIFRNLIPKSVTGNLKRSAAKKVIRYPNTAVGLVGYKMSHDYKNDSVGWAQGFIEYGTKARWVRGGIASSWNKRGFFDVDYDQGEVTMTPPYPRSFFKKANRGQHVYLAPSPEGGIAGVRPLKQTWDLQQGNTTARLIKNMTEALETAWAEAARRIDRTI